MPRYFVPITIEELGRKIEGEVPEDDYGDNHLKQLTPTVEKDLSKVQFDTENLDSSEGFTGGKGICGYHHLANAMPCLGVSAGGDWEFPIFFIIYWDGSKLRGYIPEEGNPWNTDTKQAFGNDSVADLKNCKKRWPERYKNHKEEDELDGHGLDPPCDTQKILEDIMKRILPRPTNQPKKIQKTKPTTFEDWWKLKGNLFETCQCGNCTCGNAKAEKLAKKLAGNAWTDALRMGGK